jgi:hypothetical protein
MELRIYKKVDADFPNEKSMLSTFGGGAWQSPADRAVVCLRSSRFWGLNEGQRYGSFYAPTVTRGG